MNRIRPTAVAAVAATIALTLAGCGDDGHDFGGVVADQPQAVADFELTSAAGPIRLSDFAGRYTFVYFGYTYCPDLCPDALSKLARVRRQLGADADRMAVLMVSVDPDRDTPERLADYVKSFDETFVGATGTDDELDAAGVDYGLYYAKGDALGDGYLVDHTARIFLHDPDGRVVVSYSFDATDDDIVADIEYLLDGE
jgi:protein SCO1/2